VFIDAVHVIRNTAVVASASVAGNYLRRM
jgi:hypothetical protein